MSGILLSLAIVIFTAFTLLVFTADGVSDESKRVAFVVVLISAIYLAKKIIVG